MPKVVFTPSKSVGSDSPTAHDAVQHPTHPSESVINNAELSTATDQDVLQQHSYDSELVINSAGSDNAELLVNLNNLATIAGDQAAAEELSVSEKRANGARLIVPGFVIPEGKLNLINWPIGSMKPALAEMRAEIKLRNSNCRPDHCQINKCIEILRKTPCLGDNVASMFDEVETVARKTKHSKIRDAPRMVNVILELQEEHLLRDKTLTREDLDTGEINSFFRKAANLCNEKLNENLLINRCPLNSIFNEFTFHHHYDMDEGVFRSKCNELRGVAEKGLANFRISGQGDGFKTNNRSNDDDSFESIENSVCKGVSKEHSLKVHSSEMFDFLNLDPVACCLHTCLIKNQLLESFASDMPDDSCGGSSSTNSAACRLGDPNVKTRPAADSSEKGGPPIIRAARVLVEGMMPIMGKADDDDNNDNKRKYETEDLKDDALEKAIKRMNEAEKMKNDESIVDEVAKDLNTEYHEHMVKRVKKLIKEK